MPYAVYEALLMGVPVVAFPIGGQAELISQTPSAQFMAEETSAKAFIQAVMRIVSVESREMVKLRRDIAEVTQGMWPDKRHLYGLLRLALR
jgi:glycosyltransferase involved in cell wall biosynthesis